MKNLIKKHAGPSVIRVLKYVRFFFVLPLNYLYDYKRFVTNSTSVATLSDQRKLQSLIIKDSHRVEKGMALPSPRPGFGKDVVCRLIFNLKKYDERYGVDDAFLQAINCLSEYYYFNVGVGYELGDFGVSINELIGFYGNNLQEVKEGGTFNINKNDIFCENRKSGYESLVLSRYSIRNFSSQVVRRNDLLEAVALARKSPSVCNRQSVGVYFVESADLKSAVLNLQNGNRGFGHTASHVAIVTSDIRCFEGASERNQPFFDAGLFAMTFVYALHSLEIGSCFLNWSVEFGADKKIRKLLSIPDYEVVTTLIAIGSPESDIKIAQSPRRSVSDIARFID